MFAGKLVFSQLMKHLPLHTFRRCVRSYNGEHKVKCFSCIDQLLIATDYSGKSARYRGVSVGAAREALPHEHPRRVARNTLANALRDWRVYADFAQRLIRTARDLYANEPLGVQLSNTVHALDSTTVDLCGAAAAALGGEQLRATQIQLQTIIVEPHPQPMADQSGGYRVEHLAQREGAGAGDVYQGLLVVAGAGQRQRPQMGSLGIDALQQPRVLAADDLIDKAPISRQVVKVRTAS